MSSLSFATQAAKDTWLTRMDPRAKLLALGAFVTLSLIFLDPKWLVVLFLLTVPIWLFSGIDLRDIAKPIAGVAAVLVAVLLGTQVLFAAGAGDPAGEVLAELGPFTIDSGQLTIGLIQVFRLGVPMSLGLLLFMTTDPTLFARALRRLRMPMELTFVLVAAIRFFPMFVTEADHLLQAQQVRGLDTSGVSGFYRRIRYLLFPLLVSMLRKARYIGLAVETKGFGARATQAYYRDVRFRRVDYLAMALAACLLAGGLYIRYWVGVGGVGFRVT